MIKLNNKEITISEKKKQIEAELDSLKYVKKTDEVVTKKYNLMMLKMALNCYDDDTKITSFPIKSL